MNFTALTALGNTRAAGPSGGYSRLWLTQLLRIMRLMAICLFACALHVSANSHSQTITLKDKNLSLEKILHVVSAQTGFDIVCDYKLIQKAKTIDLDITNVPVAAFLTKVLSERHLDYAIERQTVVIKEKPVLQQQFFNDIIKASDPVTGIVIGEDGRPLSGANITVKGTKRGTTTNADGLFSIEANNGDVLIISSIGFTQRLVTINGNSIGNISMILAESKLDEVQIIAYGKTTQRLNPGNVSTIKSKDIESQNVQNPLLALAGRVPGVFISQSSGVANGGVKILIQGQNSIGKGNEPFYVIDGVPYTSQLNSRSSLMSPFLFGQSGVTESVPGNPLSFINPNDIESISVLKDADATAIYGSRAANGAILITTKRGKSGTQQIKVNAQWGIGDVTKKIKMLNTQQYLEMRNEAIKNDSITVQPFEADINGIWDTTRYTNWQDKLISNTANYTTISGSVSGGSNSFQYIFGGSYHSETSVFSKEFSDQKISGHFSLSSESENKKFHVQFTGNYMYDINKLPATDLTQISYQLAPTAPELYTPDGQINYVFDSTVGFSTFFQTPARILESKYANKTSNLIAGAQLRYTVFKNFELKTDLGYNALQSMESGISPFSIILPENRSFEQRGALFGNNRISSWSVEPQSTYKLIIGNHNAEFLLGASIQRSFNDGMKIYGYGQNSDEVLEDPKAAITTLVQGSLADRYKYFGFFGRINYNFSDKYILSLNARRDGTSRFGPENRFHTFGSIGGVWIFSKENFFKDISLISFGKIRGSYGTTGSDQIGNYSYLDNYIPYNTGVSYQGINSISSEKLNNPYLQWEETRKFQFGIELGLLKDIIFINASWFRNISSNQLLSYQLPVTTGFASIVRNFPAKVQNRGYEISISSNNIKRKSFNWTTSLNVTLPKNKLLEFPDFENSTFVNSLIIGQPLDNRRVFKSAGVNPETGLYQFMSADGKLTSSPDPIKDKTKIVKLSPDYYGGFQNTLTFKGFSLDFIFQFVKQLGGSLRYGDLNPGGYFINQPTYVLDRWQKPGDIKTVQKFTTGYNPAAAQAASYAVGSDLGYTNASYIRLKNLSFSWNIPATSIHQLGLKGVRIFTQCQNIITITKYEGLDPENASGFNLPPLRTITVGIEVNL
jgi:TonB-dependent starch-binding outer membrane protein SusC